MNVVLLRSLFTFLWTLLLVVPGIIKAISYSQTLFIAIDNPEISANDAIDKSKEMMNGYKWKYFLLALSFIGWIILGIFTLGIGFLWIIPYISIANAKFYEDLKNQTTAPVAAQVNHSSEAII